MLRLLGCLEDERLAKVEDLVDQHQLKLSNAIRHWCITFILQASLWKSECLQTFIEKLVFKLNNFF